MSGVVVCTVFEVVSAFGFFNGWRIRWPCFQTLSTVGSAPSRIHLLNFEKADLSRFRSIESGGRERNRASAIAWRRPVTYWWTRWCLTTTSWAEARVAVVAIFVIFGPRFINQHDLIGIDVRHGIRSSVTSGRDIRTGHQGNCAACFLDGIPDPMWLDARSLFSM